MTNTAPKQNIAPKPFGSEYLEEMLTVNSDVYGATSICSNGTTYYQGTPVDGDQTSCTND